MKPKRKGKKFDRTEAPPAPAAAPAETDKCDTKKSSSTFNVQKHTHIF